MKLLQRFTTSSKWQASLVGAVWALGHPWLIKWGISEEQFFGFLGALGIGVTGQAVADFGKEAK